MVCIIDGSILHAIKVRYVQYLGSYVRKLCTYVFYETHITVK